MNKHRISTSDSWSAAFRRLGAAIMQGLDYRFDLLNLEFQEEKQRFFASIFLTLLTAFLAFLAFLCLNALLLILMWDTHRVATILSMTGGYLALAVGCALWLRHRLQHAPEPFAASLGELRKDYSALGGEDA